MKIKVKLHPNSSQEKINQVSESFYEVWIKEKPIDNKANEKLIRLLKRYFRKPVKIIKGIKSKLKIVEIDNEI